MDSLPLDDPRWKDLDHRNWRQGKRSEGSPDAPFVPDELALLVANPSDSDRFTDLWPWLCSEGATYAAAYAAVPYFVQLSKRIAPEQRFDYLCVIGLIVTHSHPEQGESFEIKDYLAMSYEAALAEALPLIAETLTAQHDVTKTRYLLGALAALKGHRKLAEVLQDMDCVCATCPTCGTCIHPEELREAVH